MSRKDKEGDVISLFSQICLDQKMVIDASDALGLTDKKDEFARVIPIIIDSYLIA